MQKLKKSQQSTEWMMEESHYLLVYSLFHDSFFSSLIDQTNARAFTGKIDF